MAVRADHRQVDEDAGEVEQACEPARHEDDVEGLDPEIRAVHRGIMGAGPGSPVRPDEAAKKSGPGTRPGPASLIAVITVRRLLREEKQGTTTSRLSFIVEFSRGLPGLPEG